MRTERIVTNLTCNQNCLYCDRRSASDDRAFIHPSAVRARIARALAAGAAEIVLTGGEPALRRDLGALVRFARDRGAQRVAIETNATRIDEARAADLRDAGLDVARVHLDGFGDATDDVTRDEGGFQLALVGLRALSAASIPIEITASVTRSTRALLPLLPAGLAQTLGPSAAVRGLVVGVPVESPIAAELLTYEEAAEAIGELDREAKAFGLRVTLRPDSGPPPCMFPKGARFSHLFQLTPGGRPRSDHTKVDACDTCLMADRCSGLSSAYLARFGVPPSMAPITEERLKRRLSLIATVEQQIERELVTKNRRQKPGEAVVEEAIVRVNFHCNQACRFCFVSTHLPAASEDAVRGAITEAGARGARITLSGGEPTLNPAILDYIRLAKSSSRHPVELQTNAVRMADGALARELAEAGLDEAFVSLHGSTAAISDAITEAEGTFDKTLLGIDHLREAGVRVILNYVICQKNHRDPPDYVRMVAARFPSAIVNLSFVYISADVVPKDRELLPRYAEAMPYLEEAVASAKRLGVTLTGYQSMCGIPLCVVPGEVGRYASYDEIPEGFDQGEFMKADACVGCALEKRCYGVRKSYADLYGTGELTRLAAREGVADGPSRAPAAPWEDRVRRELIGEPKKTLRLSDVLGEDAMPKTPCTLPWRRLELHEGGSFGPCCAEYMSVREQAGPDAHLPSLWNGSLLKGFRAALSGEGHPETCRRSCPVLAGGLERPEDLTIYGGSRASVENQIRMISALIEGRSELDSTPIQLNVATTSFCNYDCLMCDCGARGTLDDQKTRAFYDSLSPFLDTLVLFDANGGEPLASPEFRAFIDGLDVRERPQLGFHLTTNGSYLTPAQLAKLDPIPFSALTISLNAATAETYEAVNRGLPLARVRENLDELLRLRRAGRLRAPITYSMVILLRNLSEVRAFAEMGIRDGVFVRYMLPMRDRNGQSIMTSREAMTEAKDALVAVASRFEEAGIEPSAQNARASARVLEERLARGIVRAL